jgi:hypothetical protein
MRIQIQNSKQVVSQSHGKARTLPCNRPASSREYNIMVRKIIIYVFILSIWAYDSQRMKILSDQLTPLHLDITARLILLMQPNIYKMLLYFM